MIANSADEVCPDLFLYSEEMLRSTSNDRYLNSFLALPEECQEAIRAEESFQDTFRHRLETYYESAIDRGLTIDEENYRLAYQVLGEDIPAGRLVDIENNRNAAREICGGDNSIDRRADLPPVRNQGSIGWCYAYAAADLVSYELDQNISARDIAQQNNLSANRREAEDARDVIDHLPSPSRRESGDTVEALFAAANSRGFCPEEVMPSGIPEEEGAADAIETVNALDPNSSNESDLESDPNGLGAAMESFQDFDKSLSEATTEENRYLAAQRFCEENRAIIQNYFPQGFEGGVVEALVQSSGDSFQYLSESQCSDEQRVHIDGEIEMVTFDTPEGGSIGDIDRVLENGGIVAVHYYTDVFGTPSDMQDLETHASTVVGRQWDEEAGRCQYILRNSYGANCTQYPEHANIDCEGGNLFIYEDQLDGHVYQFSAMGKYVPEE